MQPRLIVTIGGAAHKAFVAKQPAPIWHVWDRYVGASGKVGCYDGITFFTLPHPRNNDDPDKLHRLKALLERLNLP